MHNPEEVNAQLLLKKINHMDITKAWDVSRPVLSTILTNTRQVLLILAGILRENSFALEETERGPEEFKKLNIEEITQENEKIHNSEKR